MNFLTQRGDTFPNRQQSRQLGARRLFAGRHNPFPVRQAELTAAHDLWADHQSSQCQFGTRDTLGGNGEGLKKHAYRAGYLGLFRWESGIDRDHDPSAEPVRHGDRHRAAYLTIDVEAALDGRWNEYPRHRCRRAHGQPRIAAGKGHGQAGLKVGRYHRDPARQRLQWAVGHQLFNIRLQAFAMNESQLARHQRQAQVGKDKVLQRHGIEAPGGGHQLLGVHSGGIRYAHQAAGTAAHNDVGLDTGFFKHLDDANVRKRPCRTTRQHQRQQGRPASGWQYRLRAGWAGHATVLVKRHATSDTHGHQRKSGGDDHGDCDTHVRPHNPLVEVA